MVARLQAAFDGVKVHREAFAQAAAEIADTYERRGQAELAKKILERKDESRLTVLVPGQEPKHPLLLMVLREWPIVVGFGSEEHLTAIQPLLEKCATVLGYEVR